MLDFDAILGTWLAAGAPMTDFRSAQQEPRDRTLPSADCWASCVLRCPRRHALERLRVPAIFPQCQEHDTRTLLRFHHATAVEHAWISALRYSYLATEPSFPLRARGFSGTADAVISLGGFPLTTPIEIKATGNKMSAAYFRQIMAYMYMLDVPEGYLILDHQDGNYEAIRVLNREGRYRAFDSATGEAYLYNKQEFSGSEYEMEQYAQRHSDAYLSAGLSGQLAMPTKYQCVKMSEDKTHAVPLCPWFCWDEQAVARGLLPPRFPVEGNRIILPNAVLPLVNGMYG